MTSIHIKNGRLLCPAQQLDKIGALFIQDNQIVGVDTAPAGFKATQEIDATNCWVLPGLFDLAVALREPGYEYKATIASETRAAAKGGVTTLCCPPTTHPVMDTTAVIELIQDRAENAACRILPIAAAVMGLNSHHLTEMAALKSAGSIAVSNAGYDITDTAILKRCFQYAASFDIPFFYTACDAYLSQHGVIHDGGVAAKLGLSGIPNSAETIAISRALLLQAEVGVRLHFCRLSTQEGVEMLAKAQAAGAPVTADVAIHQLLFTEEAAREYDGNHHVIPPYRTEADRQALLKGLADGTIQAICSDHQPHEITAKLEPFADTAAGISQVEFLLPLVNRVYEETQMDLHQLLACVTTQAAACANAVVPSLQAKQPADVCIFNPTTAQQVQTDNMLSSGHNTPLLGETLTGTVEWTIQNGNISYQRP